ncbi:MAG: ABC transporter permease, partial [Muribaculum sp.]|nr:ABC transporter permease [Muribaculum sp.]
MMNILKQTWVQVKSQKMLSIISVIGTALSIFLIMVVVMLQQVKVAPFAPEGNRDRFLHAKAASITSGDGATTHWESNGCISYKSARYLFEELKTPE